VTDGPALTRVLDAVRDRVETAGDGHGGPSVEVVAELTREALRRQPEGELRKIDVATLADHLVAGARLLARRDEPVTVAVLPPADDGPAAGSVLQLVTDDRPFLLSTVIDELERTGLRVVRQLHPIVGVDRDDRGHLRAILTARDAAHRETLLHLVLDRRLDDETADLLADRLTRLVGDVRAATDDFPLMRASLRRHAERLRKPAPGIDEDDAVEVAALLDWLLDEHVILLGVRAYDLVDDDGHPVATSGGEPTSLRVTEGSGAGLLGDEYTSRFADPVPLEDLPRSLAPAARGETLLTWSRTRRRSTVQRRVRMEQLALAQPAEDGRVAGVLRVLVLFTRRGEDAPADATPVLRRKLAGVLDHEDIVPGSHDEVVLTALFQALPKDELFPVTVDALRPLLVGLLHAEDHREIRTLLRIDDATWTVSVLVAVPRDTYSPLLRDRIGASLRERFGADRVDVAVSLGDRNEALARYLLTLEHEVPAVDPIDLEAHVRQLARSWVDEVSALLAAEAGLAEADRLVSALARRLPRSYRDTVDPSAAVDDLRLLDRALAEDGSLAVDWRPDEAEGRWRLRTVSRGAALELSAFLPILESLGLVVVEEVPHRLLGGEDVHLHDFGVRATPQAAARLEEEGPRQRAADTILAAWRGHAEVDRLAQLALLADLNWREVAVLRAYRRYRRQLGTPYTPAYVEETLVEHGGATAALLGRFRARFDPDIADDAIDRAHAEAHAGLLFDHAMEEVTRLDADRILRGLAELVDATVRTNAYRHDARADATGEPYIALKFDPSLIADAPVPVPHREVFVHSPRVEGVHLRAGPVARGGLRWSDRRDDVRSEVLDLVKAQVLKNALIVPTGAKGGFVLARPPADDQALRDEVERQYVTFVRGLLDVTDDLDLASDVGDEVLPPPRVVRHDGDDPYLVVAADRGTSTFSDTANAVAARYGYWLGDGFASGGSRGYDHKALGVTAKGAWRAVARHFRELGVDVATEPITIAGVGDLSGDVFSNGLLRSDAVQLVAAFDHRHIFLDPDPDPAASFAERRRVAALHRSTWDAYDRDVLSRGGFIAPRDARSIPITPEVQERLRIGAEALSPPELVRAILTAPVDLLWAGGIGTYIKARDERHTDVGDRANDEIRVDADTVRARVIGEGANLFVTQRARIELARRGARVDQDSIHNAAGVATSDAEVNLKILLDLAIAEGRLAPEDRDAVLADLADDVVVQVLDAVDRQVAALSAEVDRGAADVGALDAFIRRLEEGGDLDRQVEVLPSSEELAARADAGASLTRPELATLLAWAKRELKEALLASDAPEDPVLADAVVDPFPGRAVTRFGDLLPRHRLRRELVATAVANGIVDRLGITLASGLAAESGVGLPVVARAIRVAMRVVDAPRWWQAIEGLGEVHDPARVRELASVVDELVIDLTATLLTDPLLIADPMALRSRDAAVAAELLRHGFQVGSNSHRRARLAHARWLVDDLVDPDLARCLACAPDLAAVPDIAVVAAETGDRSPVVVADVAFRLAEQLGVTRLETQLERIPPGDGWRRRQHRGVERDLRRVRRHAAAAALRPADQDADAEAVVAAFLEAHAAGVERARQVVDEVVHGANDLDAIAVALRAIRDGIGT
jgi:glutamate dehydrogenase